MLPTEPDAAHEPRFHRACLAAAFAVPLAWFFLVGHFRPDYLVDEAGHLGNVYHFLDGKPGWPEQMTMLPGYHYLVAALWQLHPPFTLLTLARLVSTLTAWLGLMAFALAWTRVHRPGRNLAAAGPATLLLSLLPIFQPYTGLAYTDVPALAFALVAVAAHLSGHRALAALAFVPAVLTRQTNLLWPAFLVAADSLETGFAGVAVEWTVYRFLWFLGYPADRPATRSSSLRPFLHRTRWLLVLLALSAVALAVALATVGRLTPGAQTGNDLAFNPATLHFAGLLVLLLGLPVWLAHLPAALRDFAVAVRAHPARTLALTAAGLAVAGILTLTFRNPHQWNRDLFWDGCTFTLLRNWPLVGLDAHLWLRIASGLNLVLMALALARTFALQPRRGLLWLALLLGLLQPFTNSLVEPRYFLPAAVFVLLGLDLSPATIRRLALWWFLLCAVHAPFIARGLSLW